jgi:hypothetical protein
VQVAHCRPVGLGDRFLPTRGSKWGIPLISDRQLRQAIDDLIKLERKCFASRSRFAFYDYLAAVIELYIRLRRTKQAKKAAARIAKLFGLREQNRAHPIRVIIDATSSADNKTKSRWTRALRYAWHKRREWSDLRTFLRENGGPAGCAEQFAAINPRGKYPGCIVYRCPGTGRPYLIVQEEPSSFPVGFAVKPIEEFFQLREATLPRRQGTGPLAISSD